MSIPPIAHAAAAALGGKGNWDDQIAREAAATLEMDVTASELFPSPPAARSVSHRDILEPPENITELDDWVKKVCRMRLPDAP